MSLLSNVNFVEKLLRSYLGSYQDKFIIRAGKSLMPHGSPCTLVYQEGVDVLWVELERQTNKTYISLFETVPYDADDHARSADDFPIPGLMDIPAGISRIVAVDVTDPRGQETLRDIIKDTLCEISAEFLKKN